MVSRKSRVWKSLGLLVGHLVFSTFLPLLALARHFPSLNFSFLSGEISVVLRLCESAELFGSEVVSGESRSAKARVTAEC